MNIFKMRTRKKLIRMVKKLRCSERMNAIKNLNNLNEINPLRIKHALAFYKPKAILKR